MSAGQPSVTPLTFEQIQSLQALLQGQQSVREQSAEKAQNKVAKPGKEPAPGARQDMGNKQGQALQDQEADAQNEDDASTCNCTHHLKPKTGAAALAKVAPYSGYIKKAV